MAPTTPSKLLENAMKYADELALSTPSGEGWAHETWSEFAAYVMDIARALVALGFEPGDKLSIYSYNCREWYGGYPRRRWRAVPEWEFTTPPRPRRWSGSSAIPTQR